MNKRFILVLMLAVMHLTLVTCGALNIPITFGSANVAQATAYYSAVSGADSGYAFFVSPIASEVEVTFLLTDEEGNSRRISHEWCDTAEANMRIKNSVEIMVNFPNIQHGVAASWAAVLFGQHPDAVRIEVLVEGKLLPTMDQYREGLRPEWGPAYYESFERTDREPKNRTA